MLSCIILNFYCIIFFTHSNRGKNSCKGEEQDTEPISYHLQRRSRNEILERQKAIKKMKQARNKLLSLSYLTLILILTTTVVSLFVYMKCKQIIMENEISCNVLNFNLSALKSTKYLPDANAASNLTSENVVKDGIFSFIYRIEDKEDFFQVVCVISIILCLLAAAIIPVVIYHHIEDEPDSND
ncbi:hypothetical protein CDAR_536121 [Caerostris darwini]|uniref:Uncharacterized protein n=1 Tax=Caerostris darwini TaxID=1538125 RepID=A0AAV4V7Q4_9ARAC|nr:hypothetical protein CDAR_536121 [Caerostris darwini]